MQWHIPHCQWLHPSSIGTTFTERCAVFLYSRWSHCLFIDSATLKMLIPSQRSRHPCVAASGGTLFHYSIFWSVHAYVPNKQANSTFDPCVSFVSYGIVWLVAGLADANKWGSSTSTPILLDKWLPCVLDWAGDINSSFVFNRKMNIFYFPYLIWERILFSIFPELFSEILDCK